MKVHYDRAVDAAYLQLSDDKPDSVSEMAEGVNLDVTVDNEIVGIEILDASRKIPLKSLFVYELDETTWEAAAA